MKDTVTEILKSVLDAVFSFWTFMFSFVIFMIYMGVTVSEADRKKEEDRRRMTEACYSVGMVVVNTDAGLRCAAPQSLIKVK